MRSALLCASIAEELFIISRLSRSAERSKRIFTGGVVKASGICSAAFCENAVLRESFWSNRKVYGSARSPLGGAVAQRLRGYKWRSEKSVKAIAPTGAALAFLCFDFCFRFVKGVQPLTRCGVGGVQR